MKNKINFSTINKNTYTRVKGIEKDKKGKYIKFGTDNLYPNYLIDLYNHSSIHASCVNSIVEAIRGEGLITENESVLDVVNREGESLTEIYNKLALDYKLFGGFAMEIIWSKDRTRIAEIYHIDFSYIRAKEKNHRGKCPGYFINNDWKRIFSYSSQQSVEDLPYLPMFNPYTRQDEPKQIYVHRPYRPNQEYYPLPDYNGATQIIDLDTEVDNFHVNNIKNGLAPSLSITTFTNASDDEREAIENMLRLQYQGSNNAGSLVYMDVDSPENAPVIEPIPQNGADGYYTTINDMVSQKILTAHRITSPALLGIKENTGLGNNAEEIETAYRLFLNTVVLPYQQQLLSCLENILGYNYQDINLGVVQKNPLFEYDSKNEVEVVTSQEADLEEVGDLENQVNEIYE